MRPVAVILAALIPAYGAAEECVAGPGEVAARVAGTLGDGERFARRVGPGWTFALMPAEAGWDLRLWGPDGNTDLSRITPPSRGPNERDIYGWHFRNAANTGPNVGDVNAPQHRRRFLFDPEPTRVVLEADGRGAITIHGFELTPPTGEGRARMTALEFEACLVWPAEWGGGAAGPEAAEALRACGLADGFAPAAGFGAMPLRGDLDGDGVEDMAAPVIRLADGKRGIAACIGGEVALAGFDAPIGELVPEYFDRMDHVALHGDGPVWPGADGGEPPLLAGDAIVVGIEGTSSVLLFRDGGTWRSYWQGD